jgi:hypothetical protein
MEVIPKTSLDTTPDENKFVALAQIFTISIKKCKLYEIAVW